MLGAIILIAVPGHGRRPAAADYLGSIYAFVWEGFIGSLPGAIGNITIMHQLRVIASGQIHNGSISEFTGDERSRSFPCWS